MSYEIVKNVKINNWGGNKSYPFDSMEVGDAFEVQELERLRASQAAYQYANRHDKKFSCRKSEGKIWIIRLK